MSDQSQSEISAMPAVQEAPKTEYGVTGLVNLGNTCYANSVIQALRSIPSFTHFIMKETLPACETANSQLKEFWEAFQQLVTKMWKNHRGVVIRPTNYFSATANLVKGTVYEEFGAPIPNDAHEYYTFLLDKFQQATHIPQKSLPPHTATEADRAWHKSFEKDYSKFVPLFYGQLQKTIQCQTCKNNSASYEVFNTIKINLLNDNEQLIKSIQATFATEEIDEYYCNKCLSSQKATIVHKIIKTPPYLSITINRFTEGFGVGRKDNKTFALDNDEFLDLSSVVADDTNKQYSLMSMIDHHGSMLGGHYICHIKHVPNAIPHDVEYNGPKPGQWYLYDDDSIYESSKPHISQATYMLFLRRI